MTILLDECDPVALRLLIHASTVETVEFRGWKGWTNGQLLTAAKAAGFTVVVTSDRLLYAQADLMTLGIALVVLPTNRLSVLRSMVAAIPRAIDAAEPGRITMVAKE
jgi:hypothetical protein